MVYFTTFGDASPLSAFMTQDRAVVVDQTCKVLVCKGLKDDLLKFGPFSMCKN